MTEIPLTRGMVALVDDEDVGKIAGYRWFAHRSNSGWYARSCTRRKVRMHRVIVGAEAGQLVDHRNGDTLDNRRTNLRIADAAQSAWNRGPQTGRRFKGVRPTPYRSFEAHLTCRGQGVFLGTFKTREQAARAYDAGALRAFGEFAYLNFPPGAPSELATALSSALRGSEVSLASSLGLPRGESALSRGQSAE